VGFVQDGLGNPAKAPDVSSIGSLYYEPIWFFYRGKGEITKLSQLIGKRIAIGQKGGSTHTMALKLLKASGLDEKNTKFIEEGQANGAEALRGGRADVAIFIAPPDDGLITGLIKDKAIKLLSLDQAEAMARQFPYLHHLVLPHGAIDLKENLPPRDTDLVAPTATLLVKDSLHPALVYLLLRAASQVHSDPGLLEKKDEFPYDKDYTFPLSEEAKSFYKSGIPFWQKHLPFWLATLVNRFILVVIPLLALFIPTVRMVPKILNWRMRGRFYRQYGELKFLEGQIAPGAAREKYREYVTRLDHIEDQVSRMKWPLDFSDHVYHLREHIHYVRKRLQKMSTGVQ
jgi:uncharacterized protein